MTTIIILLILLIGVYSGARRGLILQVVHLVGYAISLFLATKYHVWLSEQIEMLIPYPSATEDTVFAIFSKEQALNIDQVFYKALAFVGIIFIGWVLTRIIGYLLTEVSYLPVLKQFNSLGGAIFGFVFNYIGIFYILMILSMVPIAPVQSIFEQDSLAAGIVKNTPVFSNQLQAWWTETTN